MISLFGFFTLLLNIIFETPQFSTLHLKSFFTDGVSLKLYNKEIYVNESESWNFSFISDGNPQPTVTCVYIFNSSVVGKVKSDVTTIGIEHANCIDTGLYMCTGNNTIGTPVSKSAYIKVACKYIL